MSLSETVVSLSSVECSCVFAMASAGGKLLSAEERRRQKELEEARKAGLAAPEVRHALV